MIWEEKENRGNDASVVIHHCVYTIHYMMVGAAGCRVARYFHVT